MSPSEYDFEGMNIQQKTHTKNLLDNTLAKQAPMLLSEQKDCILSWTV